jgi:hypothetical protein
MTVENILLLLNGLRCPLLDFLLNSQAGIWHWLLSDEPSKSCKVCVLAQLIACWDWAGMSVMGIPIPICLASWDTEWWTTPVFPFTGITGWGCNGLLAVKPRSPDCHPSTLTQPHSALSMVYNESCSMKIYVFTLVECLRCLISMMKSIFAFQLMHSLASLFISMFCSAHTHQVLAFFLE